MFSSQPSWPPDELTADQADCLIFQSQKPQVWLDKVNAAVEDWCRRSSSLASELEAFRISMREEQKHVTGKINHVVLAEMLASTGHTDKYFVKDLLRGFPVTERVDTGGLGKPIPGGQRSNGRVGHGCAPDLDKLRESCGQINTETIRRARHRVPRDEKAFELAFKVAVA